MNVEHMVNLDKFVGSQVYATDGDLGEIDDVFFDDNEWRIRYVVIGVRSGLEPRKVLISPKTVRAIDKRIVSVDLSCEEIQRSVSEDEAPTVSHRQDHLLSMYYREPVYWWGGEYPDGWAALIVQPTPEGSQLSRAIEPMRQEVAQPDMRLLSFKEVKGYRVSATDDEFGHVESLLADSEAWDIRYLDVDTRNYLPSRHVLLKPIDVRGISENYKQFHVALRKEEVMNAPNPEGL